MSVNMSRLDRRLRAFLIAPAAVVIGIVAGPASVAAIVLYAVGAIMLATATVGFCPIYALLRLDGRGRRLLPH
jgi:hypothetical protein